MNKIQKVLFDHVGKTSNRLGERKDILKKVILKFEMGQAKKWHKREFNILRSLSGPFHNSLGRTMTLAAYLVDLHVNH